PGHRPSTARRPRSPRGSPPPTRRPRPALPSARPRRPAAARRRAPDPIPGPSSTRAPRPAPVAPCRPNPARTAPPPCTPAPAPRRRPTPGRPAPPAPPTTAAPTRRAEPAPTPTHPRTTSRPHPREPKPTVSAQDSRSRLEYGAGGRRQAGISLLVTGLTGSAATAGRATASKPVSGTAAVALLWRGDDSGDRAQRRLQLGEVRHSTVSAGGTAGAEAEPTDRHAGRHGACLPADVGRGHRVRAGRRGRRRSAVPDAGSGMERGGRRDGPRRRPGRRRRGLPRRNGVAAAVAERPARPGGAVGRRPVRQGRGRGPRGRTG